MPARKAVSGGERALNPMVCRWGRGARAASPVTAAPPSVASRLPPMDSQPPLTSVIATVHLHLLLLQLTCSLSSSLPLALSSPSCHTESRSLVPLLLLRVPSFPLLTVHPLSSPLHRLLDRLCPPHRLISPHSDLLLRHCPSRPLSSPLDHSSCLRVDSSSRTLLDLSRTSSQSLVPSSSTLVPSSSVHLDFPVVFNDHGRSVVLFPCAVGYEEGGHCCAVPATPSFRAVGVG